MIAFILGSLALSLVTFEQFFLMEERLQSKVIAAKQSVKLMRKFDRAAQNCFERMERLEQKGIITEDDGEF